MKCIHSLTFNAIFALNSRNTRVRMSYFGSAVAASSVCGPRLLVQAIGDGEERNVVVPQLRTDSLGKHPMQKRGLLEIHLLPNTVNCQDKPQVWPGLNMRLHVLPGSRTSCFDPSRRWHILTDPASPGVAANRLQMIIVMVIFWFFWPVHHWNKTRIFHYPMHW